MSLHDDLRSPEDMVRLRAAERAAREGGAELIGTLLDMALHDPGEVQTAGGMVEAYREVGSTAAHALKQILNREDGLDGRVREVAFDLKEDDDSIGRLLYHLGPRYEPVREELAASDEARLRMRGLKAVLSLHRTRELTLRFLADPAPELRIEAIEGAKGVTLAELEQLLTDPVPLVRRAAAKSLRYATQSEMYVTAACAETVPEVREAFLPGLIHRRHAEATRPALVAYLADGGYVQRSVADALTRTDDPGVAAAIASRILVHPDERWLAELVAYERLLTYVPELRGLLEHLHRHTPYGWLRGQLAKALQADPAPIPVTDPVDGLTAAQQARLLREVLRWALTALEQARDSSAALRAWLDAPEGDTADQWVTDLDRPGTGVVADCLRAAASGDVRQVMAAGVRAAEEAARRDPAPGWVRLGPDAGVSRAVELTRLAQLCTARQIRAGIDPLPPGPLSPMLMHGPDALRVGTHHQSPSPALELRRPYPMRSGWLPLSAVLQARCPGCGTPVRTEGPVQWLYHDDDRTAESEDGFAGTLIGACAESGAEVRAEVRITLTRRGADSREQTWDAVDVTGGRHG
ncbi:hypothetical protein AB0C12_17070 [Actinoplanes sp. NPDC048967]|uniref:hypothetical protein n=1 Tax=Actinoplanes sp. NPDC048967 TaxID=3155269 RepID=UPI0033C30D95